MIQTSIKFEKQSYVVLMDETSPIVKAFIESMPLEGESKNIGGEIFFRADDVDLPFDGTEREEFDVGDIVYWRSSKGENKFAVAMFYGNTKFSDWKSPRAAGPCVKLGKISDNVAEMKDVETGETIRMEREV